MTARAAAQPCTAACVVLGGLLSAAGTRLVSPAAGGGAEPSSQPGASTAPPSQLSGEARSFPAKAGLALVHLIDAAVKDAAGLAKVQRVVELWGRRRTLEPHFLAMAGERLDTLMALHAPEALQQQQEAAAAAPAAQPQAQHVRQQLKQQQARLFPFATVGLMHPVSWQHPPPRCWPGHGMAAAARGTVVHVVPWCLRVGRAC